MTVDTRNKFPVMMTFTESMPAPIIDEASATVTYLGDATLGSPENSERWRIRRITVTGTITKTEYAQGSLEFAFKWSDRATYTYSR